MEFRCKNCKELLDMTSTPVPVSNNAETFAVSIDCDNCDSYVLITYITPVAQYFNGEGKLIG